VAKKEPEANGTPPAETPAALTASDRERLRFLAGAGVKHPHVPTALLERAVNGDELAPADVGRLRDLLEGQPDIRF
jgi:hypothetical protein